MYYVSKIGGDNMKYVKQLTDKDFENIARLLVFTAEKVEVVKEATEAVLQITHTVDIKDEDIMVIQDFVDITDYSVSFRDTETTYEDVIRFRTYMYQVFGDVYAREFLLHKIF